MIVVLVFMAGLVQSGLITPEQPPHKYNTKSTTTRSCYWPTTSLPLDHERPQVGRAERSEPRQCDHTESPGLAALGPAYA